MASQTYADYANVTSPLRLPVEPGRWGARVKRYAFQHTLDSALSVGQTLTGVAILPPKARVVGGELYFNAGLGASTSVDVGIPGAGTKYANAKAVGNLAVVVPFAANSGEGFFTQTVGPEVIVLTARGATWASGAVISGYIDVLVGD